MDETYRPTIRTQADLEEVWRHVMGPRGFSGRSIWMLRLDPAGVAVPLITEIGDCDGPPEPEMAAQLGGLLRTLDGDNPDGSFAFLISRPGVGIDADDRAWAQVLLDAGRVGGVRLETVHLANDAEVRPLPPDDLTQRRSA